MSGAKGDQKEISNKNILNQRQKDDQVNNLSLLLSKVRSVKEKLNEIQVSCSQFNIICLTETHLDSLVPNTMLFDAADKPVFMFERSLYGGGVLIAGDYGLKRRQQD